MCIRWILWTNLLRLLAGRMRIRMDKFACLIFPILTFSYLRTNENWEPTKTENWPRFCWTFVKPVSYRSSWLFLILAARQQYLKSMLLHCVHCKCKFGFIPSQLPQFSCRWKIITLEFAFCILHFLTGGLALWSKNSELINLFATNILTPNIYCIRN